MSKLMHNLIMYHEIHKLKRQGFKAARIAQYLVMDRRTVKKYLAMNEEEYLDFKHQQLVRSKLLDSHEPYVKSRLEEFPDASAAQVHDWLKEHHSDFLNVNEKTVFNFVLYIRQKHGIPKPFNYRDCTQVEQLPYGQQAQVDFGEYNMSTEDGKRKKVYFFSMVLSRSRQKYVVFTENPFHALDNINAHENSFRYFQGIPGELVYDQDKIMLVDENKGNLILTEAFRQYVNHRKFKLHFCRKADPQSKGKVENVIKYIKYNFLRGRKFIDIQTLNAQALAWLERTANAKTHAATKLVPHQQWLIERQHLTTYNNLFTHHETPQPYTVRKDNTIAFKGNFYQLPPGTYKGKQTRVMVKYLDGNIIIFDTQNNEIARYKSSHAKGKLISNSNFRRDYSSNIGELICQVSGLFSMQSQAFDFLQLIRQDNPRYIRDQLILIRKMAEKYPPQVMDQTLEFCVQNQIMKANDMESVAKKIQADNCNNKPLNTDTVRINTINKSAFKIIPDKSSITDYEKLMN